MNKNHPQWITFIEKLEAACDFRATENNDFTWNCNHDHEFSRKILTSFENIDIERSIKFFEESGGFCDCEILFNVVN